MKMELFECPDCGGTSCSSRGCGSCSWCFDGYVHEPGCTWEHDQEYAHYYMQVRDVEVCEEVLVWLRSERPMKYQIVADVVMEWLAE